MFRHQAESCWVYAKYLSFLEVDPKSVNSIASIPFMPISFFKDFVVKSGEWKEECIYLSSGTSNTGHPARHFVQSRQTYLAHTRQIFENIYGSLKDYTLLALLPSYQERTGSSLIDMVDYFMSFTQSESAYFLNDVNGLRNVIKRCQTAEKKPILLGVSYALLDYIEDYQHQFPELIVIETGGMKGRRKEMTRSELHQRLSEGFGVEHIHSEYGMTELMSQCYSKGNGLFEGNDSLMVLAGDIHDPFDYVKFGQLGRLNLIDLANKDTCAFIATSDLGRVFEDGTFAVEGRLDHSDVRGCNLLVSH